MCNKTVPSITLQTAVLMQVQEFASNNQTFSVHDITRNVRGKVNGGEWEIPEAQMTGASFRNDIPHVKIKDLFTELWQTGAFDQYLTLSRTFNGTYFEYTPTLVATVPAQATTMPLAPVVAPVVASPAVANASLPMTTDNQNRVQMYLENCKTRNFRPNLKQVQSAIKRDLSQGQTCDELYDYIISLGYTITSDPDALSRSQVVIV